MITCAKMFFRSIRPYVYVKGGFPFKSDVGQRSHRRRRQRRRRRRRRRRCVRSISCNRSAHMFVDMVLYFGTLLFITPLLLLLRI